MAAKQQGRHAKSAFGGSYGECAKNHVCCLCHLPALVAHALPHHGGRPSPPRPPPQATCHRLDARPRRSPALAAARFTAQPRGQSDGGFALDVAPTTAANTPAAGKDGADVATTCTSADEARRGVSCGVRVGRRGRLAMSWEAAALGAAGSAPSQRQSLK